MPQRLQNYFRIIGLTLPHPAVLGIFGLLQAARIGLPYMPPGRVHAAWLPPFLGTPWWAWALAWLVLLWISALEYSLRRKERFDLTSSNFFKAFLDFLIQEGHGLFQRADDKDFYTQITDWQRKVVEGLAIGLGHEASESYFQKMEGLHPLAKAYRESENLRSNEPLCAALQGNLEELDRLRKRQAENLLEETVEPAAPKRAGGTPGNHPRLPAK